MKIMNFFLALSILCLISSCAKEEANIKNDVFTSTEDSTHKLSFPDGVTMENAAEWFNQLPEEQVEQYILEESNSEIAVSRACGTWSSWSGWLVIRSTFSCLSRSCSNSQSQERIIKRVTL